MLLSLFFTVGRGSVAEEGGGRGGGFLLASLKAEVM